MPSPIRTRTFDQSSGSIPTATRKVSSWDAVSSSISEPPSAPVTPMAISSMRAKSSSVSTVSSTDETISCRAWSSSDFRSAVEAP
jgi:phosphoribosylcarboxyaminoimidazole (NCAIR) mutase